MKNVNKVANKKTVEKGPQKIYEVTIKDTKTKEIIYRHKGYGGMTCSIEKVTKFGGGNIKGVHQVLGWGNPMLQFYCYERIKEFLQENGEGLVDAFMKSGILVGGDEKKFREIMVEAFKKL